MNSSETVFCRFARLTVTKLFKNLFLYDSLREKAIPFQARVEEVHRFTSVASVRKRCSGPMEIFKGTFSNNGPTRERNPLPISASSLCKNFSGVGGAPIGLRFFGVLSDEALAGAKAASGTASTTLVFTNIPVGPLVLHEVSESKRATQLSRSRGVNARQRLH